jgi:cysteinyl-tRNA synthetase
MIMKLALYNSLTKQKEAFSPIDNKLVKMYVCGPTVYDHPHIGNARSVVVYDILYRILTHIFGNDHVRYVRNITDIDDKIMIRALEEKISVSELTKKTTKYFHDDMDYLFCKRPNVEPKATEHLNEMIVIINKLLEKNIAYQSKGHVYFDVSKAPEYNKLSGRTFADMISEVRIENSEGKKNPEDFVLWKPSNPDDDESARFNSPFGEGRPGWHIECSAMSHKYLGETFDIHGGGADLVFPHHTNEIAQSCSAFPGSEYAKTWVHNGFLTVNHEKMSKSLGNFTTVRDLRNKGLKGEVVRLFLLSNHYRKPIDYNDKAISDASGILSYWYRAVENLSDIKKVDIPEEFINCLLDDMNSSKAIKVINEYAKQIHSENNAKRKYEIAEKLLACANFLGTMNESSSSWFRGRADIDHQKVEKLLSKRLKAKRNKDWQAADRIRSELHNMGIDIEDKPDGSSVWKIRD